MWFEQYCIVNYILRFWLLHFNAITLAIKRLQRCHSQILFSSFSLPWSAHSSSVSSTEMPFWAAILRYAWYSVSALRHTEKGNLLIKRMTKMAALWCVFQNIKCISKIKIQSVWKSWKYNSKNNNMISGRTGIILGFISYFLRNWTQSWCPYISAIRRGLSPLQSSLSMGAWRECSSRSTASRPDSAAKWAEVHPYSVLRHGLAPCSMRIRTVSVCPVKKKRGFFHYRHTD